jgi:hypothetical protein
VCGDNRAVKVETKLNPVAGLDFMFGHPLHIVRGVGAGVAHIPYPFAIHVVVVVGCDFVGDTAGLKAELL